MAAELVCVKHAHLDTNDLTQQVSEKKQEQDSVDFQHATGTSQKLHFVTFAFVNWKKGLLLKLSSSHSSVKGIGKSAWRVLAEPEWLGSRAVSYTHLTLPTTAEV